MKRIISAFLMLCILLSVLCSCGLTDAAKPSSAVSESSTADAATEPESQGDDSAEVFSEIASDGADESIKAELETARSVADGFVDSLIQHEPGSTESIGASDYIFSYPELSEMVVNSAVITDTVVKRSNFGTVRVEYTVSLDVSNADGDIFKDGKSDWILAYQPGLMGDINCFCPVNINKRNNAVLPKEQKALYNWCNSYSTYIGGYIGYTDVDDVYGTVKALKNENKQNFIANLLMFLVSCCPSENTGDYGYPASWVREKAQSLLGIEPEFFSEYADDDMIELPYLGGSWCYCTMTGCKTEGDTRLVTMNFYADALYTFIAKTLQYTFTDNGDGSFKLTKQELLFDSGYFQYIDSV